MFFYSLIFLLLGTFTKTFAESPSASASTALAPVPKKSAPAKSTGVIKASLPKNDRTVARQGLVFDYNSWFENIRILGGTPYDTKALLYGLGLSYEYSLLHVNWGWGWGGV